MQSIVKSIPLRAAAAPRVCGLRRQSPVISRWASSSTSHQQEKTEGASTADNSKSLTETSSRDSGALSERSLSDQPDYAAPIDHGTSNFSPLPKRVMDGSEPGEVLPAAILSGAPVEMQGRTVRIYRPTKTATQSGSWHGHQWRMDWDILNKGHRWENPLMGWQSSADFMQGTHLSFHNKEDAIKFAEKQGYEYFVQEHNERKFIPKAYANNFLHTSKPLKHIRTK